MTAYPRVALAALLLVGVGAHAAPASPCTGSEEDFAFWLGSWAVHTADGTLAGHNRITLAEGGCRIDEHWRSAGGGTGSSINFRDPVDGLWEQVWHSPNGAFIRIRGGLQGPGDMLLEGVIHYLAQDATAPFRGRWTLLADERVRQYFEQQDADGDWQPWFEGFYTRVDVAELPSAEQSAPERAVMGGEG